MYLILYPYQRIIKLNQKYFNSMFTKFEEIFTELAKYIAKM